MTRVPPALRLIEEMLSGSHPSGHPDPVALGLVTGYLLEEEFREMRGKHTDTPLTKDLQRLIDRVITLKVRAELARPSGWRHRDWVGGILGVMCSILPFFIIFASLLFLHFPFIHIIINMSIYLALSMCFSITIKSHISLFSTLFLCFILVLFASYINYSHLPH